MIATRHSNGSSGQNIEALINVIENDRFDRVIFFGSEWRETDDFTIKEGPTTNLPLMSAIAECELPEVGTVYLLFDGNFITAAREHRYEEMRIVLDVAEENGKVFFSHEPAPFTAHMTPEDAVTCRLANRDWTLFTQETRPLYFRQLSLSSEEGRAERAADNVVNLR